MMSRPDRILALVLGAALVAAFLWSEKARPPAAPLAKPSLAAETKAVTLAAAREVDLPVVVEAMGTVRSRRQVAIAARVLAEVKSLEKSPGDAVAAGETLVLLESSGLEADAARAEAALRSLEEALGEARTEHERTRRLLAREAATRRELDLATYRLSSTTADRDAAVKELDAARARLGYATIAAPFAGIVHERHVDPGDLASPGLPLLGVYDPRELRLEARVDESLLGRLAVGAPIEVLIGALGPAVTGKVGEIVPAIEAASRTGTVKIDLPPESAARPGAFGRARIPAGTRRAVVVPREALVRRGQLEMVFTVAEADGATRARMRLVRGGGPAPPGGPGGPEEVEILTGLAPGTAVVVSGAAGLADGAPVDARAR